MEELTIGKIAIASGTGIETIRFYEKQGLLGRPKRLPSGYRIYSEGDISRLRFIRRAKELGFTLAEIKELLTLRDKHAKREPILKLAKNKLAAIDDKIASLQKIKRALKTLTTTCSHMQEKGNCPLISSLSDEDYRL